MMVTILRLLGVLAIFAVSISAYNSADEKKAWNKCLKIDNAKEKKSCIVQFEKRFYPQSVYNDDELNWSDIDWSYKQ
jgi:hypothetical protein